MNCSVSLNFTFPERIRISILNFLLHDADTAIQIQIYSLVTYFDSIFRVSLGCTRFWWIRFEILQFWRGDIVYRVETQLSFAALRLDSLHCLASILEHRRNSKNKNYTFVRPVCLGGRLGSCFHTPASVASQARQSVIDLIHSSISRPLCPTFVSKPQKPKHAFRDNRWIYLE